MLCFWQPNIFIENDFFLQLYVQNSIKDTYPLLMDTYNISSIIILVHYKIMYKELLEKTLSNTRFLKNQIIDKNYINVGATKFLLQT